MIKREAKLCYEKLCSGADVAVEILVSAFIWVGHAVTHKCFCTILCPVFCCLALPVAHKKMSRSVTRRQLVLPFLFFFLPTDARGAISRSVFFADSECCRWQNRLLFWFSEERFIAGNIVFLWTSCTKCRLLEKRRCPVPCRSYYSLRHLGGYSVLLLGARSWVRLPLAFR